MQLQSNTIPAREVRVSHSGEQTGITVLAEQSLVIETSPHGAEVLNASPPSGKKWNVTCRIEIEETDI